VTHLLHCLACDDVRSLTLDRTFCACGRSSARVRRDGILLIGPGRVFEAGRDHAAVRVARPPVAIAM
jgi:hypothetical protein